MPTLTAPTPVSAPVRTVIVDDEPSARRGIRLLLDQDPSILIVGEAASGPDAVTLITNEKPQLAFMDVQMPGCTGFEALNRLGPASPPVVVFVTAYDEHALKAFEVNAVDYLLKPYDDLRFFEALNRAKRELRRRGVEEVNEQLSRLLSYFQDGGGRPEPKAEGSDRILIKSSGEIFFLKAEEIDWIEADGDYMKFHVGGRAYLMRETMGRLEARLDPKRFVRIHRSTIVNIDRMRKLSPSFAGEYAVVLADGTKLKLSRGYHERIATLMKQVM